MALMNLAFSRRSSAFTLLLFSLLFFVFPSESNGQETALASWSASSQEEAEISLLSPGYNDYLAGSKCIRTDQLQGVLEFNFKVPAAIWQGPFQDFGLELAVDYYDLGLGVLEIALGDAVDIRSGNLLGKIQKTNSRQWKQSKLPLPASVPKNQELLVTVANYDFNDEAYIKMLSVNPRELKQRILADFERALNIKANEGTDCTGSFSQTDEEKKNGKHSGKLGFDFTRSGAVYRNRYVEYQLIPPLGELQAGNRIGMWVKAKGEPYNLRVRIIDRSGETFQSPPLLEGSPNAAWTYVTGLPADSWGHWGGDKNGKIDYPARLIALLIDKTDKSASYQTKGFFYVDDLSVVSD